MDSPAFDPTNQNAELNRLVVEAVQTQAFRTGTNRELLHRLRIVDEWMGALPEPVDTTALLFRPAGRSPKAIVIPAGGTLVIGRDTSCELSFPDDAALDVRHCSVTSEDDFF